MGEAIITRAGAVYNENSVKMGWKLYTEIFTSNTNYTVPTCKNQELTVLCFGSGGAGSNSTTYAGGGGGNLNKQVVSIAAGQIVPISIAGTTAINSSGGTTSFGTYLSATGGQCAHKMVNGLLGSGGNGGTGGGSTTLGPSWSTNSNANNAHGGHGYYGGGGGGAGSNAYAPSLYSESKAYASVAVRGGNGGIYGGYSFCSSKTK